MNELFVFIIIALALILAGLKNLMRPYRRLEGFAITLFAEVTAVSLLITFGIIYFLSKDSVNFFNWVSIQNFLLGTKWKPMLGYYGFLPLLLGTLLITTIGACLAVPLGVFIAIYTAFYASPHTRLILKPSIELLAGIPSIIYGFFALVTVAPGLYYLGSQVGLHISTESALAVGLVMGVMMLPYMASLADDALRAVPLALKENSYALGATEAETIKKVLLPAALPGLVTAFLLSISRAIGETMLVVMAAGLMANLTMNPLESVTTITVQIVSLLTGDQEFDRPETLSAFALGLALFVITFFINLLALLYSRRYRKKYG
jgi:phosphate transport system permease protein